MKCTQKVRRKKFNERVHFKMGKYTSEFKLEVVKYYLEKGSYESTAKHFNIAAYSNVKKWVKKYEKHGARGLMRSQEKYDGKFKVNVIKYMHENHLSLLETAIEFNLSGDDVVKRWERIYYEEGESALNEERRGRSKKTGRKPPKKKLAKKTEEDLIEEVQRLRMENAYLKKLDALVRERVQRENGKK